ncbi:DNA-binding protein [Spirosoma sp. RP8]|uniref:DNA-binding protein n=1 Tax=Spirosoma liriopis TaxID=2937440 RepID=A0ABT0HHE2_9BACT|nr:PPC domain-containing DNA-binding protein [Spirosoma liriopis]MCK8491568.1 DNA-binding protein [Spirosoma liriopis]
MLPPVQQQSTPAHAVSPKYMSTPTGYVMVLRQGDNVLYELEQLAVNEKIPSASFSGFGFVHPTFGFWNAEKKDYDPKSMRDTEMASMTGSIAWKDDKPALHVHGVVTDKNFNAFGGHILALEVGTGSVEITITVHKKRLEREVDQTTGAAVLRL